MQLVAGFLNKKAEVGLIEAVKAALRFIWHTGRSNIAVLPYRISGTIDYHLNPRALKQSEIGRLDDRQKIREEFISRGAKVIDYHIDKADFEQWLKEIDFPESYSTSFGEVFTEKALEHYLSSRILGLNEGDVYVDVAAAGSPFYDLAEKRYKCKSLAVDLNIKPGMADPRFIQCDATDMPFADASISRMALHCAFEMFENDADMMLIEEANRVLSPGGRLVIIPLYMSPIYHVLSGIRSMRRGIRYGKAKRVWRNDRWHAAIRFSRHYSVEAFWERVVNNMGKMSLEIYHFTNEGEMKRDAADQVYVRFAACFTKEEIA